MNRKTYVIALAAAGVTGAAAPVAGGQVLETDWTGAVGDYWDDAGNWSGGVVPNEPGAIVNFGTVASGEYVIGFQVSPTVGTINYLHDGHYTTQMGVAGQITIAGENGQAGAVNGYAGNHWIEKSVVAPGDIDFFVADGAAVRLIRLNAGGDVTKRGGGELTLATVFPMVGQLVLHGGKTQIGEGSMPQAVRIGAVAGDDATLAISRLFRAYDNVNVGDSGSSSLAAKGTLELNGYSRKYILPSSALYVAAGNSVDSLVVGTVNHNADWLYVDSDRADGFTIGGRHSAAAIGTYNLHGGTVETSNIVRVGGRGTGSLNVNGGRFTTTAGVNIADLDTATGTLNLAGGTLVAPSIRGGAGQSSVRFAGGTFMAVNDMPDFMAGVDQLLVSTGGTVIDTQAYHVTLAGQLNRDPALGSASDGGIKKSGSGTLTLTGNNAFSGALLVDAGTLIVDGDHIAGSVTAVNFGATLGGTGTLVGAVINNGTLRVDTGASDPLDILGPATFSTATYLELVGDLPLPGESVDLLTYASFTGGFSLRDIDRPVGLELEFVNTGTVGKLVASALYDGDANLDGAVDLTDFVILRNHFNQSGNWLAGDFTGDGTIDLADFVILRNNFGSGGGNLMGGLPSIPEPGSLAWLTVVGLLVGRRRAR